MSYRELRAFTETMRILGYEQPISVESFRKPNIVLVCEVIFWLVRRYEPSAEISFEISHETDRIDFFKRICETVLNKSRIRLNPKKLYQADGYAVQEMMKLANLLKEAVTMKDKHEEQIDYTHLQAQVAQRNLQDAKRARQLCTELTTDGSNLYFMLDEERASRPNRERVLSRATEISEFERRLRDLLVSVANQVESLQDQLTNLSSDESNLEQKIESKKTQLERAQKRLNSLLGVKPAFMEDYQRYEAELNFLFVTYLEQYRNLEYLEHILAKLNKVEDELLAEQEAKLKVMRDKIRKEELTVLRGSDYNEQQHMMMLNEDGSESSGMVPDSAVARANAINAQRTDFSRGDLKRPRAASGRTRPPDGSGNGGAGGGGGGNGATAKGSLAAGKIQIDEDDDDDSSLIDDDDEDDSDEDEEDSDDSDSNESDGEEGGGGDSEDERKMIRVSDSDEE